MILYFRNLAWPDGEVQMWTDLVSPGGQSPPKILNSLSFNPQFLSEEQI